MLCSNILHTSIVHARVYEAVKLKGFLIATEALFDLFPYQHVKRDGLNKKQMRL